MTLVRSQPSSNSSSPPSRSRPVGDVVAEVLSKYWDGWIPVKPEVIATRMGVTLVGRGGPGEADYGFSGYFHWVGDDPVIEFNMGDALVRRRFTVAHELGHYALGHREAPRDKPASFGTGVRDPRERAANQFAAELLMPATAVQSMVLRGDTTLEQLAATFMVSKVAMGYRLTNLSLNL